MIVTTTIVGCSTVIPVQQARPTAMRQPDMAMFGRGRAPIPPRVPVRRGQAAYGVSAPFSDSVFTFRLMNNVRIDGDPDKTGIITRVWVAGVDKPLAHFASQIKIWNQPRIVPWLAYGDSVFISLPPCQFLDGSSKCQIEIYAQIASWHYDMLGNQVPGYAVRCASIVRSAIGGYGEIVWNDRNNDQITCPPQAQAVAVLGEKGTP